MTLCGSKPFGEEIGKGQAVAGGRKDRVERRLAGRAVVGMVDVALLVPADGRILANDDVRPQLPDDADQLPAHRQVGYEHRVRVAQEDDVADTQHVAGGPLLGLAGLDQQLRGHRRIVAALVAAGQQDVGQLVPLGRPASNRTGANELGVVGVGDDDGDPLRTRWLGLRFRRLDRGLDRLGVDRRRRVTHGIVMVVML